jgi:hypothetical protein
MRLEPVKLSKDDTINQLLLFLWNNTPERQDFIINNLQLVED